ncbi:hypothetical protein [Tropicimonas sp. IMCC34043]|uniref:hypothetical protein n=1 Tax=Tropicimonas sp. IMCC34043 TaxID=2248760 RepID=UPI001E5A7C88|nr:hypothetical protein [Tropicimonas sp. IMCC34043]
MRAAILFLRAALVALASLVPIGPAAAAGIELVMVEQTGCQYCARWNAEIAPIYDKTPEGAFAPLRRVDLRGPDLDGLGLDRRVIFTPTFVLLDTGGHELARLEGYPGEDFFWGLLEKMLVEHTDYSAPQETGG